MTEPLSVTRQEASGVLVQIVEEIVELFGHAFSSSEVRVDVDVFEGGEPLVSGRQLDSMDLVQIIAVLEERFDVSLAAALTNDEPLTLVSLASQISKAIS